MRSILALILCVVAVSLAAGQSNLPSPAGAISIGGSGNWDYLTVDTLADRLYVTHSTSVDVVDLNTNKVLKEIGNTPRAHGIALAPEFERGFISDGGDSAITVFDLKTDSTIANLKVAGANPDAILYDPFSHRVFAFNAGSSSVSVIDAESIKILGTIPLEGRPEFAVSDLKGKVYVDLKDKGTVAVIDPQTLTVSERWPLAPCKEPTGLAIDRQNRRLFVAGGNKMMAILDADNGHIISTLPIGEGADGAVFDPVNHLAISSNGEGTLTVIREDGAE